ncbi:nuclease-related domain-containing protein [Clostridium cellulovorans]|uniref:NERD domain protein n=1 Tax=Clostridium cellulovorans (strain ATCC 35296 / DSM 3052 / OCM 3 / 743B) TaxID=573061 RepID=D9SR97_CLOC7|nr:nuclease-related domain-containing protein [Clostridium cellulovorans]ADL52326.1 NERD domain protein [Clostridium cellulovorans 743B]
MDTNEIFFTIFKPSLYFIIFIIVLMIVGVALRVLYVNAKYKNSKYKGDSGNSLLKAISNAGNYGEYLTFTALEKLQGGNKILSNVYIPREDGTTTEIGLIMLNKSGIYVFESKNYSGWIFGDENNKNWTQSLNGKVKNKFYNPVWQNKAHISALMKLLRDIDSNYFYSYIVFSERCELKKVFVASQNVYIVKRNALLPKLKKDINGKKNIL